MISDTELINKILDTPYKELSLRQQAIKKSIIYALTNNITLQNPIIKGYMQGYVASALHYVTSVMAYGGNKQRICNMLEISPDDYDRLYYFFRPLGEDDT